MRIEVNGQLLGKKYIFQSASRPSSCPSIPESINIQLFFIIRYSKKIKTMSLEANAGTFQENFIKIT